MEHVEPTQKVAKVVIKFVQNEQLSCLRVPLVDEYENEEQEEGNKVYTMDDLNAEITTALTLGEEGVLTLPHVPDPAHFPDEPSGLVWVCVSQIQWMQVQ